VHAEDYVHRIGRTGRAGKAGLALTIMTTMDKKHIAEIEKLIARPIPWFEGANFESLAAHEEVADPAERPLADRPLADKGLPPRAPRGRRGNGEREPRSFAPRSPELRSSEPRSAEPHRRDNLRKPRETPSATTPHRRPSYAEVADERPVIGMGDHTPMFLLRPVKPKPAKMAEEQE